MAELGGIGRSSGQSCGLRGKAFEVGLQEKEQSKTGRADVEMGAVTCVAG